MQNKILKGALVGTMVFSVLYELVALIGRFFLIRIAHLFTNIGLVYDIYNNVQLAFIIAGLALLLANRNSVSAVLGGGVLSLRALMLLSQAVLWCVYGILGNTAARNMIYPDWMSWTQIVLFVAAYCLIAMHYKSPVMLLLGIVAAVLKVVIQVLYTCFEHELMGMTAYVTVSGIFGILVFATGLIYLICWLRKTSQK